MSIEKPEGQFKRHYSTGTKKWLYKSIANMRCSKKKKREMIVEI